LFLLYVSFHIRMGCCICNSCLISWFGLREHAVDRCSLFECCSYSLLSCCEILMMIPGCMTLPWFKSWFLISGIGFIIFPRTYCLLCFDEKHFELEFPESSDTVEYENA
jgi:hypothetical protein